MIGGFAFGVWFRGVALWRRAYWPMWFCRRGCRWCSEVSVGSFWWWRRGRSRVISRPLPNLPLAPYRIHGHLPLSFGRCPPLLPTSTPCLPPQHPRPPLQLHRPHPLPICIQPPPHPSHPLPQRLILPNHIPDPRSPLALTTNPPIQLVREKRHRIRIVHR